MTPRKGAKAAIYCRISRDAEETGLGVQRQEDDCRARAKALGLEVVKVYTDNDISASRYAKKARPEFDAMIAAIKAREIVAVVAYSNSRITRRNRELEDLIDLHNATGVQFYTVASGDDDLSTADGRMVARIKASVDAGESERMSERRKRANLQRAQSGAPQTGARAFGWKDKEHLDPVEAKAIRRAVRDLIAGDTTIRGIARTWNDAGLTTVPGNPWIPTAVRAVLRNPRLAQWKVHQGRGVKAIVPDKNGAPVRGKWTRMISDEDFDALQAVMDGLRPGTRAGARTYLLSGVLRCAECGSRFHGFRQGDGYTYACSNSRNLDGHSNTITGPATDTLVLALVAEHLRQMDLSGEAVAPQEWEGEARLRQIPLLIEDALAAYKAGKVSGALTWPLVEDLEAEQRDLAAQRPKAAPVAADVSAEDLLSASRGRQRTAIDAVVQSIVVRRAERKGARFNPDRLTVVWR